MMKYETKMMLVIWGSLLVMLIVPIVVIWVQFFADCRLIGWLPVTDMPGRCFTAR
jgi:hypothetical protein